MIDDEFSSMSDAERRAWVKREQEAFMHQVTMVAEGLAVRRAGLVYFLPLCHDAYGENY